MHWRTHVVVGANAIWITTIIPTPLDQTFPLLAVSSLAALLPDIDATTAKIHFIGGGTLGSVRGLFRHRAFFHSLLAVAAILFIGLGLNTYYTSVSFVWPLTVASAYSSHLLIDGFNYKGVEYLFPWRKSIHLLPKPLRSPLNGIVDNLLFVAGIFGLLAFLLRY